MLFRSELDFGLAEVDSSGNLLRSSAAPSQPDFPELDFTLAEVSSSGEILQPQVPPPPQDFPELDFSLAKVSSSGELLRSAAPSPPLFHPLDFSLAQLPDTPKANFHDSVPLLDFSLPSGNIISSRSSVRSAEKSAEKFEGDQVVGETFVSQTYILVFIFSFFSSLNFLISALRSQFRLQLPRNGLVWCDLDQQVHLLSHILLNNPLHRMKALKGFQFKKLPLRNLLRHRRPPRNHLIDGFIQSPSRPLGLPQSIWAIPLPQDHLIHVEEEQSND